MQHILSPSDNSHNCKWFCYLDYTIHLCQFSHAALFKLSNVAHPATEKCYSLIELPNTHAKFFAKVAFFSDWPTLIDFFFFPSNNFFSWITSNNQPVEIFAKLLALSTNLRVDEYFHTTDETNVSLWISLPLNKLLPLNLCLDLGSWDITKLNRCLLKYLLYFADSETC